MLHFPVPVTLRSKFELSSGPSTPKPTIVQFLCDGSTLSGMRLKLDTQAYKVSLYKNKVIAGKEWWEWLHTHTHTHTHVPASSHTCPSKVT